MRLESRSEGTVLRTDAIDGKVSGALRTRKERIGRRAREEASLGFLDFSSSRYTKFYLNTYFLNLSHFLDFIS